MHHNSAIGTPQKHSPNADQPNPPRNALETAAAWPEVQTSSPSTSAIPAQAGLEGSPDSRSPPQGYGANGQPAVQSWSTGRLVGPSSPTSPSGEVGEEDLPDWLLSTLGEMGGSDEKEEPTSPVAQYLAQDPPTGPRRSDLKLAGRRGPTSPPHPALRGVASPPPAMRYDPPQPDLAVTMTEHRRCRRQAVMVDRGRVSPVQWAPADSFPVRLQRARHAHPSPT